MEEVRWIVGDPPPPRHGRRILAVTVWVAAATLAVLWYRQSTRDAARMAQQRREQAESCFAAARRFYAWAQEQLANGYRDDADKLARRAAMYVEDGLAIEPDSSTGVEFLFRVAELRQGDSAEDAAYLDGLFARYPDCAQAHLVRVRRLVEPYLDRWAIVQPLGATDTDPELARMREAMLGDLSVLLGATLTPSEVDEVEALNAFVTNCPIPDSKEVLADCLRAWRLLSRNDPSVACSLIERVDKAGRWKGLALWTQAHCEIELLRIRHPGSVTPDVTDLLLRLPDRFTRRASYWIDRAAICLTPAEALDDLRKAVTWRPGDDIVIDRLASAAEANGDFYEALEWLNQMSPPKGDEALLLRKAHLYEKVHGVRDALGVYDQLCEVTHDAPAHLLRRAELLLLTGDPVKALAAAMRSKSAIACWVATRIFLGRDDLSGAASWSENLLRADPVSAPALAARGRVLVRLGHIGDATDALHQAIQIDPRCRDALLGLGELREKQGRLSEARATLDQVHADDDLEFLLYRAGVRERCGCLLDAVHDLDAAVRLAPDRSALFLHCGELKLTLEDLAGARADAERARVLIPRGSAPWKLLAFISLAEGKGDEAEADFCATIRRNPHDAEALFARGQMRLALKHRAAAEEDLDAAVEADPQSADALYLRMKLAHEDGRREVVLKDADRFLAIHAKDARTVEVRAWQQEGR